MRVAGRPEPTRQPGASYWTLRIGCRPGAAGTLADALARRGDTAWISIGAGGAEITCQAEVSNGRDGLLHHLPRASSVLTFSAHQVLHRFPGRGELDWIAPEATSWTRDSGARWWGRPTARPDPGAQLGPADLPLLDALGREGRASWAALAAATGWTQRQAAQRVTALEASGAIYFHLDVADAAVGMHTVANLWFTVAPAHLAEVGARLAGHRELPFVAAVTGATNIMASARTPDPAALYRYITTKVADIPGVQTVEAVPQLTRIKQSHSLMVDGLVREPAPPRRPAGRPAVGG